MKTYVATEGQSIYDVCLATYGTFDYLKKLIDDNSITSINQFLSSGMQLVWDDTLATNSQLSYIQPEVVNTYSTASNTYTKDRLFAKDIPIYIDVSSLGAIISAKFTVTRYPDGMVLKRYSYVGGISSSGLEFDNPVKKFYLKFSSEVFKGIERAVFFRCSYTIMHSGGILISSADSEKFIVT